MALSILKQRINKREYKHFSEFVRDCALVCDSSRTRSFVAKADPFPVLDPPQCADLQSAQIASLRGRARYQGMFGPE